MTDFMQELLCGEPRTLLCDRQGLRGHAVSSENWCKEFECCNDCLGPEEWDHLDWLDKQQTEDAVRP